MNKWRTVIYIGVTNDLVRRLKEHQQALIESFTQKYNVNELVYYESYQYIMDAINREKQLKRWSRAKKLNLIKQLNVNLKTLIAE